MIMRTQNPSNKTIYIGFHDGQKKGETPEHQFECEPIVLEITHSHATRIINHLYKELERITVMASNSGIWP